MLRRLLYSLVVILAANFTLTATAYGEATLEEEIARLKQDVAALNQELFELEDSILHPANTQVAVFLSVRARDEFVLDSVELKINDRMATSHLYSEQERRALSEGGIQQLYLGNIPRGEHRLTAVLNGQGKDDHYFRKQQTFTIRKTDEAERVELVIRAQAPEFQPVFDLKQWQ